LSIGLKRVETKVRQFQRKLYLKAKQERESGICANESAGSIVERVKDEASFMVIKPTSTWLNQVLSYCDVIDPCEYLKMKNKCPAVCGKTARTDGVRGC
jgi:hypothetical protein